MITNLQQIREAIDIESVVSRKVKLTRKGNNLSGLCPFHAEKTPSFIVSPSRNYCHCFGCGFSGDAFVFEMKISGKTFPEVVEALAHDLGIAVEKEKGTAFDDAVYLRRETIFVTNARALELWTQQFTPEKCGEMIQLGDRLFHETTIAHFGVCISPPTHIFSDRKCGEIPNQQDLINAGLIRKNAANLFDVFPGRIIFPMLRPTGKIAGFSGRVFGPNAVKLPKYLNTAENEVFKKSEILFGFFENKAALRAANEVIIVEGFTDVMRLWENEIPNVVALCGTALSEYQAVLLKKYVDKVILLLDGDEAGVNAAKKVIPILEKAGLFVRVCQLPEKHDPDSFITEYGMEVFKPHLSDHLDDAIIWQVKNAAKNMPDGLSKQKTVNFCKKYLNETPYQAMVDEWSTKLAALLDIEAQLILPDKSGKNAVSSRPGGGMYIYNNAYYIDKKDTSFRVSNFTIQPICRILSGNNTYWLLELNNTYGQNCTIHIDTQGLIKLDQFRHCIESKGNFIFHGYASHLNMIKDHVIYQKSTLCHEITRLGWQKKKKLWAWANGLVKNGTFYKADKNGFVKCDDQIFLIKAAFDNEKCGEIAGNEMLFRHESSEIDLHKWMKAIITTYAERENGYLIILYYFACIFRDIVFDDQRFFPHLFGFGAYGTGKTQIAHSLMRMFGSPQNQIMLDSCTDIGLGRQAAKFVNTITWFDEYKNAIPPKRIQLLKGFYDGAPHIRGEYSNDYTTNEVVGESGLFITGQELPNADPALFSRTILIQTSRTDFSDSEKSDFDNLKELEATHGLSHITSHISGFHDHVNKHFKSEFRLIRNGLTKTLAALHPEITFQSRVVNNYSVIWTIFKLLKECLKISDVFEGSAEKTVLDALVYHQELLNANDDKSQFWDLINFLLEDGRLSQSDVYITSVSKITIKKERSGIESHQFNPPKKLLLLRHSKVWNVYTLAHRQQTGREGISRSSLESYLKSTKSYIGSCSSWRFPGGKVSSCLVFDYEIMGVDINHGENDVFHVTST
jgi:DNA primase